MPKFEIGESVRIKKSADLYWSSEISLVWQRSKTPLIITYYDDSDNSFKAAPETNQNEWRWFKPKELKRI